MRKVSTYMIAASLAVLPATYPVNVAAQDEMPGEKVTLTAEQQAMFDSWPPDQQFAYDTWPNETKTYYWTLPGPRQDLFWRLSDDDKLAITAMGEDEREAAWQSIEARASGSPPPTQEMPPAEEAPMPEPPVEEPVDTPQVK